MKNQNITYEVCPHCGTEVELPNTLGVHICPHCGKAIVACSMCTALDADDGRHYCENCCLCHLADTMNENQFNEDYEYLYDKAYSHSTLSLGPTERRYYIDAEDNLRYGNQIVTEVVFHNDEKKGTNIRIHFQYTDMLDGFVDVKFKNLDSDFIEKLKEIANREVYSHNFKGTASITISFTSGCGRTKAEALINAKEAIEEILTTYGVIDTQIEDVDTDIRLTSIN